MPLYEFQCESCGEEFEDLVPSLKQVGEVTCPKCGEDKVRRLQSGFATIGGGLGGRGCSSTGPIG